MTPDARRRRRPGPTAPKLWPAGLRLLVPAAYGTTLLGGLYRLGRILHPAVLVLLAAFIVYFAWRIHALATADRPSEIQRVELGVLAVLALSIALQAAAVPPPWTAAGYGALLVALAPSLPAPGLLALPWAALALWEPGGAGWQAVLQLEGLAVAAAAAAALERRRRKRLHLVLDKLQLDQEHLEKGAAPAPKGDLDRLDEALYDYLARIKETVGAHGAVLAVRHPRGGLFLRELVSDSPKVREQAVLHLDTTAFQWILTNGKPLRIGRLRDPAARLGYYQGNVPIQSFVGVPVRDGDQVDGVLAVDSLQTEAFGEAHVRTLEVASHQVATTLAQIRALERVKREARDFKHLHEFAKRTNACTSPAEFLDLLLATLRERVQPDFSAVALLEDGDVLRVAAVGDPRWTPLADHRFAAAEGLAGWVLTSGQYLHYDHGRQKARRPVLARDVKLPEFPSLMLHPLVAHQQALGVLCLAAEAPRAFDGSAVAFCEVLAQQGAQGLLQMRTLERLRALATTDGLTGLANRRVLFERLAQELARSDRYEHPSSLLLLDVDHFKKINDRYGHPAGDAVLRAVARALQEQARETDLVARYGGEEFAVLLPNTDEAGGGNLAERIRARIEALRVTWEDKEIPVRLSVGAAAAEDGARTVDALVSRADQALYAAKQGGRNRVVRFSQIREYASWGT
ncbi:MAG: hypothetical protein Kow0092_39250 [Deferrisomatales bacterium]